MLALKETEFVEAARAIGVSDRKIVTKHLLPNGMGPIIVAVTLGIPAADPRRGDARLHRHRRPGAARVVGQPRGRRPEGDPVVDPHLVLFPAICIAIALISFTFLGDGLRDALDPKLKGKQ